MTITDRPYRVLIPTAGTGSRLNNLTQYINKALVSIDNIPAISRIITMFPGNTEFVIALGYKAELIKQYLSLAYPNKKFYYATVDKYEGEGSGLGLSILACERFLQQPFVFCSCDTLVTEKIPYPDKNIVGFSQRENLNEYRTIDIENEKVVRINEKKHFNKNSKAYIGLACINDWQTFWEEIHKGGKDAVIMGETYALLKFIKNNSLYAKEFTWYDTGNLEELNKTRAYYKNEDSPNILPKPDEAIWFINDIVIKYSNNTDFIKDRVKRINYLKGFVPEILNHTKNMYSYKKAEGTVLSKIQNLSTFKKLLSFSKNFWLEKTLKKEEQLTFKEICKNFYYDKTIKRINQYYETFNITDEEYIINMKKLPKLSEILEKVDWNRLFDGLPGRFHGDFHFENILYNEKTDLFTFLDWRQNFGGILEYGDIYYDLAKLNHGLIICHELIAKNCFNIQINNKEVMYAFERKPILEECEKYYYEWLRNNNYDVKKVKILTAIIYLNIAALHHYPYCHLLYFLGKSMLYETIVNE